MPDKETPLNNPPDAKVALVPVNPSVRDFEAEGYSAPEYQATYELHDQSNLYRLKVVPEHAKSHKLVSETHSVECTENEFKMHFEKADAKAKKAVADK